MAPIQMTLNDPRGHSPITSLFKRDWSYSRWQDFNWHSVARSLCDWAELLVTLLAIIYSV